MRLGRDALTDLRFALSREWLLGNGLGGSASGTVSGAHSRCVHAHLVAASPYGRLTTLLLKLEERLVADGGTFELASNLQSGGGARPAGHRLLEEFRLDPWPVWCFRAGEVLLEKSLFMIYAHNAVAIAYRHLEGPRVPLTVSPLVVARDPREVQRETAESPAAVQGAPGRVRVEAAPGRPALTLWHNGAFMPTRARAQIHYPADAVDGQESVEHAAVPGYIEAPLAPGQALFVIASAEDDLFRALAREDRLGTPPPRTLAECVAALEAGERERRDSWRRSALAAADATARQASAAHGDEGAQARAEALVHEADSWTAPLADELQLGLARRGDRLTLLASLPGAEERTCEALRASAGLITLRGFDAAREVIRGVVEYLSEGLAPEGYDPDDGSPRYGDAAPTLWLVIAAERYARRGEDLEFAKAFLYPALEEAIHCYRSGSRPGIRTDQDGLLVTGEEAEASKRADLNALWYHALVAMAQLARSVGRKENGAFYLAWANDHQKRFNEVLWDEGRGGLYRAIDARGPVVGVDPGQLLAVSLPPSLLAPERAQRLVEAVERELFTPFGLREAAGAGALDTTWLGPFYSAYLRAHGRSVESQGRVRAWLDELRAALDRGDGHVPTAFEIEPVPVEAAAEPKRGAKTAPGRASKARPPAPATGASPVRSAGDRVSIVAAAELLRVWVEELDHSGEPVAAAP